MNWLREKESEWEFMKLTFMILLVTFDEQIVIDGSETGG